MGGNEEWVIQHVRNCLQLFDRKRKLQDPIHHKDDKERKCKKKKQMLATRHEETLTRMDGIYDDLIVSIFLFLDFKTHLLRCMSVSRQWCSNALKVPIFIRFKNRSPDWLHSAIHRLTSNHLRINVTGIRFPRFACLKRKL